MDQAQTVKIGLGNICIEIQCRDQEFMENLLASYRPFLVSYHPDFRIELSLSNKLTAPEVKELLLNSKSYLYGNRFVTKPALLECFIDWANAILYVDTEKELFAPSVEYKFMNLIFRGIYSGIYARIKHTRQEAYLLHGCGIISGQRGYLFTGPSGSGKTTLASLAGSRKVLNDEAVLIGHNQDGFYLAGTPFDGGVPHKSSTSGHLSSIFFLKHNKQVSLHRLSKTETYYKLLTQIFDISPLFETNYNDSLQERADLSAEMATRVPSYELGFRPDSSFWQAVEST
jgi:hypothetical protein